MAVGWRLRLRLSEDVPLATGSPEQRTVARCALARGRDAGLLAFRAVGPRLDLLVTAERQVAGEMARLTEITLANRLPGGVRFHPAVVEDVRDQWHLTSLFRLILRCGDRSDPLHEASNLPDLLGLRLAGRYTANNVRQRLPRIKRAELLGYLEVEDLQDTVFSADHLLPSTEAAMGLTSLTHRSPEALVALTALAAVSRDDLTTAQVARLTGRSPRTVRRLRAGRADTSLMRAIRLQMCLRRIKGQGPLANRLASALWSSPQDPLPGQVKTVFPVTAW